MAIFFIGLGSQPPVSMPNGAIELIKSSDEIFADVYTSPWRFDLLSTIEDMTGRKIKEAKREFLEDIEGIIELAQNKDIAIICMGDPFIATTHSAIRIEAERRKVKVKVLYSSSFVNVLFGELGLHFYKLGYIGTVTNSPPSALASVYLAVKQALEAGRHSILLLEYDYESKFHLSPKDALLKLLETEKSLRGRLFEKDLALIVASRVGFSDQKFTAGYLEELVKMEFGEPPHSIVVPAKLHFTEEESLKILHKISERYIKAFGAKGKPLITVRTETAIEKTKRALRWVKENFDKEFFERFGEIIENVECYLDDSERFLREGKLDLALIEACYAEGLLDSLRFQGYNIRW